MPTNYYLNGGYRGYAVGLVHDEAPPLPHISKRSAASVNYGFFGCCGVVSLV